MNCLILDDDNVSRLALEELINQTGALEVIASCEKITEALKAINSQEIDIIFLDIEMPEMNGFEFLETLSDNPFIIFISSRESYALKAYETSATDYLLKPFTLERLLKAVNKVKEAKQHQLAQAESRPTKSIFVKADSAFVKLDLDAINWIESLGDYVTIHTDDKRYVVNITMKKVEEKLSTANFCRIHRSFIINLNKIDKIEENIVIIKNKTFPVSRSNKKELYERINLL
jgi:DNA-binding LytR/AlgR family response regulator